MSAFVVAAVHDPGVGAAVVAAGHAHGMSTIVVHALDRHGVETVLGVPRDPEAVIVHVGGHPVMTIGLIAAVRRRVSGCPVVSVLGPSATDDALAAAGTADLVWSLPVDTDRVERYLESMLRGVGRRHRGDHVQTLVVDSGNYRASLGSVVVELTPTECALLGELLHHAGHVVPRELLSRAVWGHDGCGGNVLERHISRLRRKTRPLSRSVIKTVHGVGYQFVHERYAVI